MSSLLVHERSQLALDEFLANPVHTALLLGPRGLGKGSLARLLAAQIVNLTEDELDSHPYFKAITAGKTATIPIEAVRELEHFLSRKVPADGKRVVIVEDAQLLSIEAQNALLKTLEEPPANTSLLLTAPSKQAVLATISSRTKLLQLQKPNYDKLQDYFQARGHTPSATKQAALMSGGLPGLMTALLKNEADHPLVQAASLARHIVQTSTFERLALVDSLAKDKQSSLDVLAILQQMAHLILLQGTTADAWQRILKQSYQAELALLGSAQPKLVLTNLLLNL